MTITNALMMPNESDFAVMERMAKTLAGSGMIPTHLDKAPMAVFAIMQKGRELQIPPMHALNNINVIKGKASANAELMAALIYRDHGDEALTFAETNAERCVIDYKRRSGKGGRLTYTIQEATNAGHIGGPNAAMWKKFPANMLRARAISAVARMAFPDSIGGMYLPEELDAPVDEDGNPAVLSQAARVSSQDAEVSSQPRQVSSQTPQRAMPARNSGDMKARVVPEKVSEAGARINEDRIHDEGSSSIMADKILGKLPEQPPIIVDAETGEVIDPPDTADNSGEVNDDLTGPTLKRLQTVARANGWDGDSIHRVIADKYPLAVDPATGNPSARFLAESEALALIRYFDMGDDAPKV